MVLRKLLVCMGLILTVGMHAQSIQDLTAEIEKLKNSIAEEERSWAEEKQQEKQKEEKRQERYQNYKKEKLDLESSLAGLDVSIQKEVAELEALKNKEGEYQFYFRQIQDRLLSLISTVAGNIDASFSFQKDKRLEVIKLLKEDLESDRISFEEAFNRLLVICEKEIRLGEDSEVFSGDFPEKNGNVIEGKYLRLGKQILLFTSPDGKKLALLDGNSGKDAVWIRESEMDMDTRKNIRRAIATADDKALPGFIPVSLAKESFTKK